MSKAVVTRTQKRNVITKRPIRSGKGRVTPRFKRVTKQQIQSVVDRIVDVSHPEKIILFGSYAYGKPTADSDVDLLVVMETGERLAQRETHLLRSLSGVKKFPMDILVRTPRELTYRLAIGDSFMQEVIGRGKVLYERVVG